MSRADTVLVKPCLPEQLYAEIERVVACGADAGDGQDPLSAGTRQTDRRHFTPPAALCPACDGPMRYLRSHMVGHRVREQWDYFECSSGCGTFRYRQRTRKLRKV